MKTRGCVSSSPQADCGPKFAAEVPAQLFAASLWIANIEYNPEGLPTLNSSSRAHKTTLHTQLLGAQSSSKSNINEGLVKPHNSPMSANISGTIETSKVTSGSSNLTDCQCDPEDNLSINGTYANHSITGLNNLSNVTVPGLNLKANDESTFTTVPLVHSDETVEKNQTLQDSSKSASEVSENKDSKFNTTGHLSAQTFNASHDNNNQSSLSQISSFHMSNNTHAIQSEAFQSLVGGQNTPVTNGQNISESSNLTSTLYDNSPKDVEPQVMESAETDKSTNKSESTDPMSTNLNNTFFVIYEEEEGEDDEKSTSKKSNESTSATEEELKIDNPSMDNSTKELLQLAALNMSQTSTSSSTKSLERPMFLGVAKNGEIEALDSRNVSISLDDEPDNLEKEKEKPEQLQSLNVTDSAVDGSNTTGNTQSASINNTITSNFTLLNRTEQTSSSSGENHVEDHESDVHKDIQSGNISQNSNDSIHATQGASETSKIENTNESGENQEKLEESNQNSESPEPPCESEDKENENSSTDSASKTSADNLIRRQITPSSASSNAPDPPTAFDLSSPKPPQALNPEPYAELISPPIHSYSKGICGEYDGEAEYAVCLWSGSDDKGRDVSKSGWLNTAITKNCGKRVKVSRPGSPFIIARVMDGCSFEVKDPSIGCNQIFLSKQVFLSMKPTRKELITGTLEGGVIWDFLSSSDEKSVPV
ncbi:hypothetical protein DFH28DRAFT_888799 [Melampsora americana]|nr:hypothetical protein DFH28DRAFT_888799 [Melampsora americana]